MCSTCPPTTADVSTPFAERLVEILNGGGLALLLSLGHRTGLFDALAGREPSTSAEIAAAAGLDERYVREWLGGMVAGRIVLSELGSGRFVLPDEHAASLTRAASPDNLAVSSQFLPMLGSVEGRIAECFVNGGGVPYEEFPRFHEVMAEESRQTVVWALREHVLPLAPGLEQRLLDGIDVLDVGCGSGRALMHLAEHYPASRFTGYDGAQEAVDAARAEAASRGLGNLRFERRDAAALGEEAAYDLVTTFDVIHDQVDPAAALAGIRRALRPEGVYLMQDIDAHTDPAQNTEHPLGAFLYTISCMHCMTVSLAKGGAGLGAMWGVETAERMLAEAGFADFTLNRLDHDPMNVWIVARPG